MPPENDAQADAIARGDVIPDDQSRGDAAAAEAAALELAKPDDADEPKGDEDKGGDKSKNDDKSKDDEEGKGPMVPQNRMKEAVGKERGRADKAEAELAKYREREQQQQLAENHEAAMGKQRELMKQHASQLADGELDAAAATMEEILQLRDDMQNARIQREATNAKNSARIEVQYDQTVQRLEKDYPEINPDADEFDEVAVRKVQAMVTGLMQSEGKNPAEALEEAVELLLKPVKEAKGETLRDKPSEEAVAQGMRRKEAQIDKNLDAASRQPPATGEVGADHDKTGGALDADSLGSMSFDEFIKIPDEELAKHRGDFIQ